MQSRAEQSLNLGAGKYYHLVGKEVLTTDCSVDCAQLVVGGLQLQF